LPFVGFQQAAWQDTRRAAGHHLVSARSRHVGALVTLEQRLFGTGQLSKPPKLAPPDCARIHAQLKRHRHVTLQLLWEEYAARFGEAAYKRSAFCVSHRATA